MNIKENITPVNKGQYHGYWEVYRTNGELVGYKEYYFSDKFNKSYYL